MVSIEFRNPTYESHFIMTTSQPYPFKHIGSFCLILFFALFRPAAIWPEVPVSTAPLAVLAAWLILLIKIPATVGYGAFLREHRLILCLVAGYFVLCGASLITNYHRYPDAAAFVRWGVTFPIIQSAVVACSFLFTLPQNNKGPSITRLPASNLLVFAIAAAIPAMTFWQVLDNESAYQLYQYTIAGDLGNQNLTTRGIFATSTDLGAISTILGVLALVIGANHLQNKEWRWIAVALFLFALNATAGSLSGSRSFFLSMGLGLVALVTLSLRNKLTLLLLSLPLLLSWSILGLQIAPILVSAKLSKISLFFISFRAGIPFQSQDFVVDLTSIVLDLRADLWHRAIEQTLAHPLLGISNGGYRLLNQSLGETPINNTHNAFLQFGVDAGAGGLVLGFALICLVLIRSKGKSSLALLASVLSSLLVDNFADHSLSWIAITTFALASCTDSKPSLNVTSATDRKLKASLITATLLSFVTCAIAYKGNMQKFESMDLSDQIEISRPIYWVDYWNDAPILISDSLSKKIGHARTSETVMLYSDIPADFACVYGYPGGKLLWLPSDFTNTESVFIKTRLISGKLRVSDLTQSGCINDTLAPGNFAHWVSNHHRYFSQKGLVKNRSQLRLVTDYIAFFSPIFEGSKTRELQFEVAGSSANEIQVKVVISYFDAKNGDLVAEKTVAVNAKPHRVSMTLPATVSGLGYLRLKLHDCQEEIVNDSSQEVMIRSLKFK